MGIDFVVILYEGINTNVEFLMGFWEHLVCFFCGKGWNLSLGRGAVAMDICDMQLLPADFFDYQTRLRHKQQKQ